jgi:hypothetical protein
LKSCRYRVAASLVGKLPIRTRYQVPFPGDLRGHDVWARKPFSRKREAWRSASSRLATGAELEREGAGWRWWPRAPWERDAPRRARTGSPPTRRGRACGSAFSPVRLLLRLGLPLGLRSAVAGGGTAAGRGKVGLAHAGSVGGELRPEGRAAGRGRSSRRGVGGRGADASARARAAWSAPPGR